MEAKRAAREEQAVILHNRLMIMKQEKAMGNQARWEEKRNLVNNLKDVEEFKRGLLMADIRLEDQKFEMWK